MAEEERKPISTPAETGNDDFEFANTGERITDLKFDTKPIGYFKDAWIRFRKSHAAVVGAVIIILIVLYAIITPLVSGHSVSESDTVYRLKVPYNKALSSLHIADGTYSKTMNTTAYLKTVAISMGYEDKDGESFSVEAGVESEFNPIRSEGDVYLSDNREYRDCRVQAYYEVGFVYRQLSVSAYENLVAWQDEHPDRQVIYPMVDVSNLSSTYKTNANVFYLISGNGTPLDNSGNQITTLEGMSDLALNYLTDSDGNVRMYKNVGSAGDYYVRVWYWNYYYYLNGKEPSFLLGTDDQGRDLATRLASGIGLSLILAVSTFVVNFTIGAIYGAIEGYYGGAVDLIMERISDILTDIPFIVLASIVNIQLIQTNKMSVFGGIVFCFVLTGWIGPAYRVRTQFYRFKNQEYVLAARTLGASDARIMWKHIFPNTLGTIITASVLTIPGTIFTESMLSYLGIINFNTGNITSLGTILSIGQQYMTTYPHILIPPCIVISLLMISFNLFGNGLRDAFNPSLRGVEE
jgi:oligopeptide transport system permease protein